MKRNCSLSPRAALVLLAAAAVVVLGIGVGFGLAGAWWILPFAGIEVLALGAALYACGRRAGDCERISMRDGRLAVVVQERDSTRAIDVDPFWARLLVRRSGGDVRVFLRSHGREVEIGRHLDASGRSVLADELGSRLAQVRNGSLYR